MSEDQKATNSSTINSPKSGARLTPAHWRMADTGERATPPCPHCGRCLGIRLGMWLDNGRDAWLCDKCGEWEAV